MTTALAHLTWPPNSANTAAWIAATTPTGGGDTSPDGIGPTLELADDSPEPPTFLANFRSQP